MNKREVNTLLRQAKLMTSELLAQGRSSELVYVKEELDRIERLIDVNWPLTDEGKASIHIGLFAARELEGWADDLAHLLHKVNYEAKHEGKSSNLSDAT